MLWGRGGAQPVPSEDYVVIHAAKDVPPGELGAGSSLPFATKVRLPTLPDDHVGRAELLSPVLHAVGRVRAICLTAPGGYGKTTLLAAAAEQAACPTAFLSLDPEDNDPAVFFQYLIAAIRSSVPQFTARATALADQKVLANPAAALAGAVVSDVERELRSGLLLILDDVHHLTNPGLTYALGQIIERLPSACTVILSGRNLPTMPQLPRLTAHRLAMSLTVDQLRLSPVEARELVHRWGVVDSARAEEIVQAGEGWAAALALLSQSTSAHTESATYDYLAAEVLDRMPVELQEFARKSALLPELSVEICEAALGYIPALPWIEDLERFGVPLQVVSAARAYRYHPLFREFLQRDLPPEQAKQCFADLSRYSQSRGWARECIQYALAAGDLQGAAHALREMARPLYESGQWATLSDLVHQVTARGIVDPALSVWAARSAVQLGEPDLALRLVDSLPMDAEVSPVTLASLAVARAGALRSKGDVQGALEVTRRALSQLPEGSQPELVLAKAELLHLMGVCLENGGTRIEAIEPLDEALAHYQSLGGLYHQGRVHNDLGIAHSRVGEVALALAHYREAVRYARLAQNDPGLASALHNLAVLYEHEGDLDVAQATLAEAITACERAGNILLKASCERELGDLAAGSGDDALALKHLEIAHELFSAGGEAPRAARAALALARAHAMAGDPRAAERYIGAAQAHLQVSGRPYDEGLLAFSQGLASLRADEVAPAREHLRRAVAAFMLAEDALWLNRSRLLLAEALLRLGDQQEAIPLLESAAAELAARPNAFRQESRAATEAMVLGLTLPGHSAAFARLAADGSVSPPRRSQGSEESVPRLQVWTLGQGRVQVSGGVPADPTSLQGKPLELLVFLLLRRAPAHRRSVLAALWPDLAFEPGASLLRTTAYRLRKALGFPVLTVEGEVYRVTAPENCWLDATAFRRLSHRARLSALTVTDRLFALEQACQLFRGSFLEGCEQDWCAAERSTFEIRHAGNLRLLTRLYVQAGMRDQAVRTVQDLLELDPLDERAVLMTLRLLVDRGDRPGALITWQAYEELLSRQLDTRPSEQAQSRARQILQAGHAAQPRSRPA